MGIELLILFLKLWKMKIGKTTTFKDYNQLISRIRLKITILLDFLLKKEGEDVK